MKIAATTVTLDRYCDVRSTTPNYGLIDAVNSDRLTIYEQALAKSASAEVDLLCLPGGYLFYAPQTPVVSPLTSGDHKLAQLIAQIIRLAREYRVAVAIGLDLTGKDQTADNSVDVRSGKLPWYAICWSPSENQVLCWNQRSVTSIDQRYCPHALCETARTIRIGSHAVEVLLCGEVFNSRIRDAITRRKERPMALVDLAHTLAGFRVTAPLKELAERGIHTMCSSHADKRGAMKYYYAPTNGRRSSRRVDFSCGGRPRLEAKVWSI